MGGLESDLHLLPPMEFHADTSELVQMLSKGHHNVQLDAEAWDRLVTWIDLNAPCHGTWSEFTPIPRQPARAAAASCAKLYGGVVEDGEEIAAVRRARRSSRSCPQPTEQPQDRSRCSCRGWPFDAAEAAAPAGGGRARRRGPSTWATA